MEQRTCHKYVTKQYVKPLLTRGAWVQVLAGAPNFKDLAAKTKSSSLLWDRCGTSYPLVRAASTEFKHLARKTRSSLLAVGPCGNAYPHVSAGHRRRVRGSVYRCGREADSPALVGDPHQHSHSDRPSNDWHGQGVLRDLRRKRGRTRATGKPRLHEGFQRLVVDLLRLEIADVRLEQCDVPLDDVDAPLTAGLRDITRCTIGKGRARTRLSARSPWTRAISMSSRSSGCSWVTAPTRRPIRTPRYRLSMNRRPSVRTAMPGVRVVAMSSSCRAEEHFQRGCKTRQVVDQRISNPQVPRPSPGRSR
jgi:hypothetical protein